MILTDNEMKALAILAYHYSKGEGEDVIGLLVKNGCFRILSNRELVDFTEKIESVGGKPFFDWRTEEGFWDEYKPKRKTDLNDTN